MATKKYSSKSEPQRLSNNSGVVIENEKLAIYKESKGDVHKFSSVCTHLGCMVRWNELEKSLIVRVMVRDSLAKLVMLLMVRLTTHLRKRIISVLLSVE